MYCYSVEKHVEELGEISIMLNKVTSMLNIRERILGVEAIDEHELADIEVCVDLVCLGTDLRPEDIIVRDGVNASFEKEDNIVVRFLTAIVTKISKVIQRIKSWIASLTDRRRILVDLINTLEKTVELYRTGGPETDRDVIVQRGLETFVLNDYVLHDYASVSKHFGRIGKLIALLKNKAFSNLELASDIIQKDLLTTEGEQIKYQVELEKLAMVENNAVPQSIEIDKKIYDIFLTVGSMPDASKQSGKGTNTLVGQTGPILGNLVMRCEYDKPTTKTDEAYFSSLNKFKLKLAKPDNEVQHSFTEVKLKRWSGQECRQAIGDVKKLESELGTLADIMKRSVAHVESFARDTEAMLSDASRAVDDSRESIKRHQAQRKLISSMQVFINVYSALPEHLYEHAITQMFNVLNLTRRFILNEGEVRDSASK